MQRYKTNIHLKTKQLLIFLVLFSFSSVASAQMNMQQHHRQVQQQNYAIQNQMRMHQQFMNIHMMNSMNRPTTKYKGKYKFNFVMLNGDTIFNNKNITISFLEPLKEIVLKNKKEERKFTPDQTKEIFVGKGKKAIKGVAHDSCWIFNTHSSSNVDFYALFPDKKDGHIAYFQEKGDSIRVLTSESLQEIVKEYPKALKEAQNDKGYLAIHRYLKEEKRRRYWEAKGK